METLLMILHTLTLAGHARPEAERPPAPVCESAAETVLTACSHLPAGAPHDPRANCFELGLKALKAGKSRVEMALEMCSRDPWGGSRPLSDGAYLCFRAATAGERSDAVLELRSSCAWRYRLAYGDRLVWEAGQCYVDGLKKILETKP